MVRGSILAAGIGTIAVSAIAVTALAQTGNESLVLQTEVAASTEIASSTESLPALLEVSASDVATEVAALEDEYYRENGRYLQILPNNKLPAYESGTVVDKLNGAQIPYNASVSVYSGPGGQGYQIFYEDDAALYSFGYGPESADRTYTITKQESVASTTEEIL